jgi:FO synthase
VDDPASTPTAQQVRRALARAERGAALDIDEAAALMAARGDELERLCKIAVPSPSPPLRGR